MQHESYVLSAGSTRDVHVIEEAYKNAITPPPPQKKNPKKMHIGIRFLFCFNKGKKYIFQI